MRRYDHFHAEVELSNGRELEVEGGWTGNGWPAGWDDMHFLTRERTLVQIVGAWLERRPANIKKLGRFSLAG